MEKKEAEESQQNPLTKFFMPFKTEKYSLAYTVVFFCRRYVILLIVTLLHDHRNL